MVSPARRRRHPPNSSRALTASSLCGSLLALGRTEAAPAGGALSDVPRVDFKSTTKRDSSGPLLAWEGAISAAAPAGGGKAGGLYVPLTRRSRPDGAVYGVDVGEGGIGRRRLEDSGVGIEEGGERIDVGSDNSSDAGTWPDSSISQLSAVFLRTIPTNFWSMYRSCLLLFSH